MVYLLPRSLFGSQINQMKHALKFSRLLRQHLPALIAWLVVGLSNALCQNVETVASDSVLQFIVVGDWGHRGEQFQKPVAIQMSRIAEKENVDFVISTGDNFYPDGVVSVRDSMWRRSFEDVYAARPLHVKWYPVLGNHDYHVDPQPQVDYSATSARWHMPARYYAIRFALGGDTASQALFVFLDTNPLVPAYFRGTKHKVRAGDRRAQLDWLREVLKVDSGSVRWRIIVAHHPMYTGGGRRYFNETWPVRHALKRLLKKAGAHVYLAGHEHSLQHLGPIHGTHHFISGAGATKTKARKIFRSRFAVSAYGFMLVSLRRSAFNVQLIDHHGTVLYRMEMNAN